GCLGWYPTRRAPRRSCSDRAAARIDYTEWSRFACTEPTGTGSTSSQEKQQKNTKWRTDAFGPRALWAGVCPQLGSLCRGGYRVRKIAGCAKQARTPWWGTACRACNLRAPVLPYDYPRGWPVLQGALSKLRRNRLLKKVSFRRCKPNLPPI